METRVYGTPSRTRSLSGCAKTKPIKGEQHEEGAGKTLEKKRKKQPEKKQKQEKQ
jgi:hypothetical protein